MIKFNGDIIMKVIQQKGSYPLKRDTYTLEFKSLEEKAHFLSFACEDLEFQIVSKGDWTSILSLLPKDFEMKHQYPDEKLLDLLRSITPENLKTVEETLEDLRQQSGLHHG